MSSSETLLWITLALCAATGGSEVLYKKRGQVVMMYCGDVDTRITNYVEWKHNSVLVFKINTKRGGIIKGSAAVAKKAKPIGDSLKIPSVEAGDTGVYTCSGVDINGNQIKKEHKLHVVSVSVSPSDTVLIPSGVTLRCDVEGDSTAQVQWKKPSGAEHHGSPGNTVTLESVTLDDAGQWTCQIKDNGGKEVGKIEQVITVVGPLQAPEQVSGLTGGTVQLPCSLPILSSLTIDGVRWTHESPADFHLLNLTKVSSSKVKFAADPRSGNFTATLTKLKPSDTGVYVCTVDVKGQTRTKKLTLTVQGGTTAATVKDPTTVGLWVWVAVAIAGVFLILLAVVTTLIYHRNRRMRRKVRKLRSVRQPLTNRTYCQCDRPVRQPHPAGKKERPPPLPRYQYDVMSE
uniref:Ig-like domain-containing protein n=1 Tax=Pygocentrus nattereri TaxID=42514 RepID=A0A3B4EAL8_PYGNA